MIDDAAQERLRAEFIRARDHAPMRGDVGAAWQRALDLLDMAATPQRYVGVDPAATHEEVVSIVNYGGAVLREDRRLACPDCLERGRLCLRHAREAHERLVAPLFERPLLDCRRCDLDEHRCPGCGTPLSHGVAVCDECDREPDGLVDGERR